MERYAYQIVDRKWILVIFFSADNENTLFTTPFFNEQPSQITRLIKKKTRNWPEKNAESVINVVFIKFKITEKFPYPRFQSGYSHLLAVNERLSRQYIAWCCAIACRFLFLVFDAHAPNHRRRHWRYAETSFPLFFGCFLFPSCFVLRLEFLAKKASQCVN